MCIPLAPSGIAGLESAPITAQKDTQGAVSVQSEPLWAWPSPVIWQGCPFSACTTSCAVDSPGRPTAPCICIDAMGSPRAGNATASSTIISMRQRDSSRADFCQMLRRFKLTVSRYASRTPVDQFWAVFTFPQWQRQGFFDGSCCLSIWSIIICIMSMRFSIMFMRCSMGMPEPPIIGAAPPAPIP